ncbi:Putative beta-barrel porin 2 [Colwellia chukchiensis]|uniref:Putative beta-barrel porin 2 n=1 Tax=Colwellia chukchiensis TaxID=641665 RepID=A0A1H7PRW3_9GAMM|nr:outer membrane beta-barrel protein [Colwellia chukchiensis]SEL38198.1 Putative beta-barrel porin 2 [Colwellia chukchiensis]
MNCSRLFTICASLCAGSAVAQTELEHAFGFDLATEAGQIDNFLYQAHNPQSTTYYQLRSNLSYSYISEQSAFDFETNLTSHYFQQFQADNHTEFSLTPQYQFKFNHNQGLYLSALWHNQYHYRGTGLSQGQATLLTEGDEQVTTGVTAGYQQGSATSTARFTFDISYQASEFTSRRTNTLPLDTEITALKSSFDYLLSGKSYLALDVNYEITDYPNNPILNRDSITALMGVKWSTTAISDLSVLVGYQQLKFTQHSLADDDAIKWRFNYMWSPSDHSKVQLVSQRHFDASYRLTNSYRLTRSHQIDVEHSFTKQLSLLATVGVNYDQFISPTTRQKEDYYFTNTAIVYQFNHRLSMQLSYHYQSLTADIARFDYLHRRFGLSIAMSL